MKRNASALWEGNLKQGHGAVSLGSGALSQEPYSFGTRFGEEGGANPEELIAAALASCYSMALAATLEKEGFAPEAIRTNVDVSLRKNGDQWDIAAIDLDTSATAPGATPGDFERIAEDTRRHCPVARLLRTDINLHAEITEELTDGRGAHDALAQKSQSGSAQGEMSHGA